MTTFRIDFPHQNLVEMQTLAEQIAAATGTAGVVLLNGPLGAGKTTWVQAMCEQFGVPESVTSPTFDLLHMYHTETLTIYHVDGYRLTDPEEWEVLDLPNPLGANTVILAEWADALRSLYNDRLEITIHPDLGGLARTVSLWGVGADWAERLRILPEVMQRGI